MKQETYCYFCKKHIYKTKSIINRYKNHFCNIICKNNFEKSKKTVNEVYCKACNNLLRRTNNEIKRSKKGLFFCNNTCKNKYISTYCRWDDVPDSFRRRKKKIYEASNNSCQNCGYNKDIRMIDIHHINGNHQDNRWSNLSCLCVWCHQCYHRKVININIESLINDDGSFKNIH